MTFHKKFIFGLLLMPTFIFAQTESQKSALKKMIETEKSFAQTSLEKGTKNAFLEFFGKDAIVFDNKSTAVNGLEYWQNLDFKKLLTWQPTFAEIAVSEELGYTVGNSQVRNLTTAGSSVEEKPITYGSFFTLWKKQPDGTWKVAFDFGINHAQISAVTPAVRESYATFKPNELKNTATLAERMVFMNDFFYWKNAKTSLNPFEPHLSQDIKLFRNNMLPIVGREAAKNYLKKTHDKAIVYTGLKAISSQAGDLVCVYGVISGKGKTGEYVRMWKQESKDVWKIVVEMVNIN
jgi:ketosteroid isomerase-like protein